MGKSKLLKLLFKVFITLISYGFIYYKIKTGHFNWSILFESDLILIALALFLMPLNWLIESIKWQFVLIDVEKVSLSKALKAVFIGLSVGMATPNRVGEYLSRSVVLTKRNRAKGNLSTVLCSWSQILATFFFGIWGWVIILNDYRLINISSDLYVYRYFLSSAFVFVIILLLYFYYHLSFLERLYKWLNLSEKHIDKVHFLSRFRNEDLSRLLVLSLGRYLVFAVQYFLLLWAFGLSMSVLNVFACIGVTYLLLFFIPQVALAELGLRGSIAILVFSFFTSQIDAVLLSASFLWLINVALPSVLGSLFWLVREKA